MTAPPPDANLTQQRDPPGALHDTPQSGLDASTPWLLFTPRRRWWLLAILFLVSTSNYFDRTVISVLLEPIKREFRVTDTMLGLLGGFCFAVFFATAGLPVARWADRGNRRTVITLALTVWSVMTICCGLAQTFWQLALARIGVGAGESGAVPPAQSLIADYFPPGRRAMALGIFMAAATTGSLLGLGFGGYIAALHGWRSAFLLGGIPGLALALVARFTLAEPRLRPGFAVARAVTQSARATVASLSGKRSFRFALAGCVAFFFVAYGALIFIPSFLIRVLHSSLAVVSTTYGPVSAVASLIGTLGGGWLADRLGGKDARWLARLPAIACAIQAPLFVLAFRANEVWMFLALAFAANLAQAGGLPSVFAAIHAVCGRGRRATAIAIVLFATTLLGGGIGPLATGALSDALSSVYGVDGLRYALMTMMAPLLPASAAFFLFAKAMPADLED